MLTHVIACLSMYVNICMCCWTVLSYPSDDVRQHMFALWESHRNKNTEFLAEIEVLKCVPCFILSTGYGPSPQDLRINKMANLNQQEGENISKDVSHIPKFNGKNYPSWKYGVWLLFRQHGLTEIVENNANRPAEVRQSCNTVDYIKTYTLNFLLIRRSMQKEGLQMELQLLRGIERTFSQVVFCMPL